MDRFRGNHLQSQKNEVVFDHDGRIPLPMLNHRNDRDLVISFTHHGPVPVNPIMGDIVAMFDADELVMGQGNMSYPKALAMVSVDNQNRKKTVVIKANQLSSCHGRFVFHYMHTFPERSSLGRSNFYLIRCPTKEELTKEMNNVATPGEFLNEILTMTKRHLTAHDTAYSQWRQEIISTTTEWGKSIYQTVVNQAHHDVSLRISDYEMDKRNQSNHIVRLETELDNLRRQHFKVPPHLTNPRSFQMPFQQQGPSNDAQNSLGAFQPCPLPDSREIHTKNFQAIINDYSEGLTRIKNQRTLSKVIERPKSASMMRPIGASDSIQNIWSENRIVKPKQLLCQQYRPSLAAEEQIEPEKSKNSDQPIISSQAATNEPKEASTKPAADNCAIPKVMSESHIPTILIDECQSSDCQLSDEYLTSSSSELDESNQASSVEEEFIYDESIQSEDGEESEPKSTIIRIESTSESSLSSASEKDFEEVNAIDSKFFKKVEAANGEGSAQQAAANRTSTPSLSGSNSSFDILERNEDRPRTRPNEVAKKLTAYAIWESIGQMLELN